MSYNPLPGINASSISNLNELVNYVNGLTGGWSMSVIVLFLWVASFFFARSVVKDKDTEVLLGSLVSFTLLSGLLLAAGYITSLVFGLFIGGTIAVFIIFLTDREK
jgi:hypothetical protein